VSAWYHFLGETGGGDSNNHLQSFSCRVDFLYSDSGCDCSVAQNVHALSRMCAPSVAQWNVSRAALVPTQREEETPIRQ
jgi:hypothetical protein